jgi:ribosomal protein L7Ae-like RNA K-turn-binding protein
VSIKDGSADPEAILKVENLAKEHQVKRVIHQRDSDLGNACNQALPYVRTKYLVRLDADNVAKPTMLDTFVKSIHSRRDVAALSCYQASFENNEEAVVLNMLKNEKQHVPRGYYKPIGPCLPVLFFQNTAGDANSIYVTDALRKVGGWPEGKGHSDWGLWLKLLGGGYLVDVIPQILYYYRARPDSGTSQVTSFGVNESLIQIIQEMITARPELLSDQWRSLHQLVRRLAVVDAELERYKKTALNRLAVVDAELERYKKTAPYALDRKFAELAHKSEKLTKLLVLSGRVIRWLSAR